MQGRANNVAEYLSTAVLFALITLLALPFVSDADVTYVESGPEFGSTVVIGSSGQANAWVYVTWDDVGDWTYDNMYFYEDVGCTATSSYAVVQQSSPDFVYNETLSGINFYQIDAPWPDFKCARLVLINGVLSTDLYLVIATSSTTLFEPVVGSQSTSSTASSTADEVSAVNGVITVSFLLFFLAFSVAIWIFKILTW